MKYLSTRNNNLDFSFFEILFQGLSKDGGLFLHGDEAIPMVPTTFVVFDPRIPHSASKITTHKKRIGIDFTVKKHG